MIFQSNAYLMSLSLRTLETFTTGLLGRDWAPRERHPRNRDQRPRPPLSSPARKLPEPDKAAVRAYITHCRPYSKQEVSGKIRTLSLSDELGQLAGWNPRRCGITENFMPGDKYSVAHSRGQRRIAVIGVRQREL